MENILEKAINLAKEIHYGELDRDGDPIIEHLLRVMAEGRSLEEKVVGVLHHSFETTEVNALDLLREGYPTTITDALQTLRRRENEVYGDYLDRIKSNRLSARVKINDLSDKLNIRNLRYLSQNRYYELRFFLAAYRSLLGLPIGTADCDRLYGKE